MINHFGLTRRKKEKHILGKPLMRQPIITFLPNYATSSGFVEAKIKHVTWSERKTLRFLQTHSCLFWSLRFSCQSSYYWEWRCVCPCNYYGYRNDRSERIGTRRNRSIPGWSVAQTQPLPWRTGTDGARALPCFGADNASDVRGKLIKGIFMVMIIYEMK